MVRLSTPLCEDSNETLTSELQEVSEEDQESDEHEMKSVPISISHQDHSRPLYHLEDIEDVDLSHIGSDPRVDEIKQTDKDTIHLFYVQYSINVIE